MSRFHYAGLHYHTCGACNERFPCGFTHTLMPIPTMCEKCRALDTFEMDKRLRKHDRIKGLRKKVV